MESFKNVLFQGLRNFEEHQVSLAAVGVVGDLARNVGNKILPYCDDIMTILLEGLIVNIINYISYIELSLSNQFDQFVYLFEKSPKLNKVVKPLILSTFGDIGLAIGNDFKKYGDVVLNALHQASLIQADPNDFDLCDYFNELREGCLDAYTGILQGIKGNNNTTGIG